MKSYNYYNSKFLEIISQKDIDPFEKLKLLELIKLSRNFELIELTKGNKTQLNWTNIVNLQDAEELLNFLEKEEEYEKCDLILKFIQNNYK